MTSLVETNLAALPCVNVCKVGCCSMMLCSTLDTSFLMTGMLHVHALEVLSI